MSRRNPQPAWRAAVVSLVWSAFMYYCIYRPPLRDLAERFTRSDTADKPFLLASVILPIVILYHAASAFCKVAPNTNAFLMFVSQVFAGASAVTVIYGYNS
ncbi:unnamed protein product [Clonostachys chloroleuca]|uniref:Uncharacterized protein n=1 Tax=Clonostachys chloroleuca TaxID=1926264 RepID=A0AA35Q2A0_9HYPO|nr:unnamed protein product [Clonostachys chloroleuca]